MIEKSYIRKDNLLINIYWFTILIKEGQYYRKPEIENCIIKEGQYYRKSTRNRKLWIEFFEFFETL
jgi:hypothetical protein